MSFRIKNLCRFFVCMVTVYILFMPCHTVFAEGSRELTSVFDQTTQSWVGNGGYRPYIEWQPKKTLGLNRQQKLNVYAQSGETIYFASSAWENINQCDVRITSPSGNVTIVDIQVNGDGRIQNRAQELAGPRLNNAGGGYTTLSFPVAETGVWCFEFHSKSEINEANPGIRTVDDDEAFSNTPQGQSVGWIAAWDITVADRNGRIDSGRVFADYLTIDMGNNKTGSDVLKSSVYIITEGYIYKMNFNGMDPFGFIFFANSRGLIQDGVPLYHSLYSQNNELSDLKLFKPGITGTSLDKTYPIFFSYPSDALPDSLAPSPEAPSRITDFRFEGDRENHGYVGQGGYFCFTAHNASSFQIKISTSAGTVYLADSCVDGENRVYWDGKDANGNLMPAGVYDETGIEITLEMRAGEVHFPLLDVENNQSGLIIELMNAPSGNSANNSRVYYNNLYLSSAFKAPNNRIHSDTSLSDSLDRSDKTPDISNRGIDSNVNGALWFTNKAGDQTALDLWTYYSDGETALIKLKSTFILEEPDNNSELRGMVFYDANGDGSTYSPEQGDFPLEGVPVVLVASDGSVIANAYTDSGGYYQFTNLDLDSINPYSVSVTGEPKNTCTTNNESQQILLDTVELHTADAVGYHYSLLDRENLTISKVWLNSESSDIPQQLNVTLEGYTVAEDNKETIILSRSFALTAQDGWKINFTGLPGEDSDGKPINYRATEELPTGWQASGGESLTAESAETGSYKIVFQNIPSALNVDSGFDYSPSTGEKSYIALLICLLFISAFSVIYTAKLKNK